MMGQQYEQLLNLKKALECYENALNINSQDTDAMWYKDELLKRIKIENGKKRLTDELFLDLDT